jgi:DNA (cytosine-5)-methyltransferase 1
MGLTFIDLFSGIGGFRLGMEQAGHTCLGHVEIDKYADISYRAMHNVKESEFYANDIRSVEPGDLPKADCYCGGFPCQSFSIAGKRGGFEDTRGTLFFEIARLLKANRPQFVFLENVRGLLSHDNGSTFETIIRTLGELGYWYEWQVLNSKNFGVPQNRERVFIIGHLGIGSGREVFPIRENDRTIIKNGEITNSSPREFGFHEIPPALCARDYKDPKWVKQYENKINKIGNLDIEGRHESATRVYGIDGIGPALNTCGGGGLETKIAIPTVCEQRTDEGLRFFNENICGALRGTSECGDKRVVVPVLTPDRAEKRQNGRRFKEDGDDMFTLTAQDKHGVMIKKVGQLDGAYDQSGRVYSPNGISPTITGNSHGKGTGGFVAPKIMIKEATKKGYAIAEEGDSINLALPESETRRGRVGKGVANTLDTSCNQGVIIPQERFFRQAQETFNENECNPGDTINAFNKTVDKSGLSPTLTTRPEGFKTAILPITNDFRIRKLTPKECFRLQGFPDDYFERAAEVNSNSQLYKQAGNSVTVNVIYEIAKRL